MAKKKSSGGGCFWYLKMLVLALILGLGGLGGLLYWQKDNARSWVRQQIRVSPGKKAIDPVSIGSKVLRGTLEMNVYNGLPLGATLTMLDYVIQVNNLEVGRGVQVKSQIYIAPLATTTLKITLDMDPQKFRQAIAQAKPEQMARLGQTVLDQLRGKKPGENSLQGMVKVVGTGRLQLFVGSFDLPLAISRSL
jgi:hypothetical protein